MRTLCALLILFITVGAYIPHSYAGKMYQWKDKDGIVHVTDNPDYIPKEYRDDARVTVLRDTFLEKAAFHLALVSKNNYVRATSAVLGLIVMLLIIKFAKLRVERRRSKAKYSKELDKYYQEHKY